MEEVMLTTIDNPFNPFTQYDEWQRYDRDLGYFTNEYLARLTAFSINMPEELVDAETTRAIDEILRLNLTGLYKKVTPNDYKDGAWKPYKLKESEK